MGVISIEFIVSFLVLLVIHWIIPDRFRNVLLLGASWAFLATWDVYYPLFLIAVVLISYMAGNLIAKSNTGKKKKAILLSAIIILVGVLGIVKYSNFAFKVLGISFFTFQAISYVIDLYREDVEEERDFVTFALYVSFFPQLLSGPIAKSKDQLKRYKVERYFDLSATERAFVTILYGLFLKLVIADRIGIFVDHIYTDPATVGRIELLAAVLLYSVQIYCDFAGYSMIAIGIGRCFGIELPMNFRQPYLAKNIDDFWKRWHISLTSWFRDYLYYPLGGNRKGKLRTYVNIIIVFAVSGIWHGAGVTFLVWGLLHGLVSILERAFLKGKQVYRILTYLTVSILWVFFRADSFSTATAVINGIFVNSSHCSIFDMTTHGVNAAGFLILGIALLIMSIVDILNERGADLVDSIMNRQLLIRWGVLLVLLFSVLIFGIYGPGYDASRFIYDKF